MPKPSAKIIKWNNLFQSPADIYEQKRHQLLKEAGKAFSRRGFHDTSLDDVAKVLGLTKPALYYYYKTKHDILYECHKAAMDLGDTARQEAEALKGNAREKLEWFVICYLDLLTSELGACAVLTEHNALRPDQREIIQDRRRAFDSWLRRLVRQGIKDGSIAPCDPRVATSLLMGAVNSVHRWFSPDGPMTGRQIGELLMTYIRDGFQPRKKAASGPRDKT